MYTAQDLDPAALRWRSLDDTVQDAMHVGLIPTPAWLVMTQWLGVSLGQICA